MTDTELPIETFFATPSEQVRAVVIELVEIRFTCKEYHADISISFSEVDIGLNFPNNKSGIKNASTQNLKDSNVELMQNILEKRSEKFF